MKKRILAICTTGILFNTVLTGCSMIGKLSSETYYLKVQGELDPSYTLKGFKDDGTEKEISFATQDKKSITEGTYLEIDADEDKDANKKVPNKISLINSYKKINKDDIPKKIKEKLN
ncbi:hypothetical protein CBR59_31125 [Bacillus thuringiensis]|uniref:DUF1093 domain-containing protein n=1 Tax=Bacillus thuringiensis TaxID=1428 RepID=UPI000C9E9AE9|nr:DUF1093 domain-containing protein [Bacillus thuringiensis]PNK22329.1 hypothetical protein CBP87_31730 [Bacillus thuringiensis]PNK45088.1 hypothetical protein CBR59_31125 [Bacillus thuringiensis]